MNEIQKYTEKIFEDIKHVNENGSEYWYARELMQVLDYNKWENFQKVIDKAKISCENSGFDIMEQLPEVRKLSKRANNTQIYIKDYKLSRYACYLIAQNGDSRKKVISLAQTYFAIQTRKMELAEDYVQKYKNMSEDEKRLLKRSEIKTGNYELSQTAKNAGVKNFDKFTNAGYKGLYNGETADDIARRKKLRYREDILDNMCSDELIANQFRISLTNQKLKKENIIGEKNASAAHFEVGVAVRNTIKEVGGILPEDFETPIKSLKEIKKDDLKKIKGGSLLLINF